MERWPRCQESRDVQLTSDLSQWMNQIIEAWDDRADPDEGFHLHMLLPQPQLTHWEDFPAPHVLVLQRPSPDRRSLHLTAPALVRDSFVDTFNYPVTLNSILRAVAGDEHPELQSEIWFGSSPVTQETLARLRQGNALFVMTRQLSEDSPYHSVVSDDTGTHHMSLLQKQAVRKSVRLTLDELIPVEGDETEYQLPALKTVAIRLIPGAEMAPLPTYVEGPISWCEDDIQAELLCWGHHCDVFRFGTYDVALCLPHGWIADVNIHHYMFCHTDVTDSDGLFLHSHSKTMTEVELMSFLYDCGYWRATIQSIDSLAPGLCRVLFQNVQVQQASHIQNIRAQPAWPTTSHLVGTKGPYFILPTNVAEDGCVIELGMAFQDFMQLFESTKNMLCRDPAGHDFPEVTIAALKMSTSSCLDDYDRIIIYTDGSSKAKDIHRPPTWNDEQGHGDSWAFVVLGETLNAMEHKVEVLGWSTQPVIYEPQSEHFIGADGIGSYLAEREALAWAALWRLSQNSKVDTLFRSDSLTSARQALGLMGCTERTLSFNVFRGLFQALEAALPPGALEVEHIHSHTGEP